MTDHQVVSRTEWQAAREELLQREKEHTRLGDELARERRELPWVAIGKEYRFDADDGTPTLAELFDGRSQLLFYHFSKFTSSTLIVSLLRKKAIRIPKPTAASAAASVITKIANT